MLFQSETELKSFLDEQADRFENSEFIPLDPISIPHLFSTKEDIEVAGFLTALLSWGNRKAILNKCKELMQRMDMQPYAFIMDGSKSDLSALRGFVYRTMNTEDLTQIILVLKQILKKKNGLQALFTAGKDPMRGIQALRSVFEGQIEGSRALKHIASPAKGSAAKRLNMYLRWMVRSNTKGVDFGIWPDVSSADLLIPLDTHSGRVARKLQLLNRKANDFKAVTELTQVLRKFDATDPVKYDYALFGLGVIDKF